MSEPPMDRPPADQGRPYLRTGALALGVVFLVTAIALIVVAVRGPGSRGTLQDRVRSVASTLRCPVCQNLSVADSPSRLATQMRDTIGRELQAGRTPAEIRAEFAASYGEWILLAPPKRGIDMALWLFPVFLLLAGAGVAVVAIRRWTAGAAAGRGPEREALPPLSDADRALIDRARATAGGESP